MILPNVQYWCPITCSSVHFSSLDIIYSALDLKQFGAARRSDLWDSPHHILGMLGMLHKTKCLIIFWDSIYSGGFVLGCSDWSMHRLPINCWLCVWMGKGWRITRSGPTIAGVDGMRTSPLPYKNYRWALKRLVIHIKKRAQRQLIFRTGNYSQ